MFSQYSIAKKKEELQNWFQADLTESFKERYNAAPTQLLPMLTMGDPKRFSFSYWGLPPKWSNNKPLSNKLINIPVASAEKRSSVKKALKNKRCIVPADGFYFWKKIGKKSEVPYKAISENNELMAFAAIWDEHDEPNEGKASYTFNIFTKVSDNHLIPITNTMPLILPKRLYDIWLNIASNEEDINQILQGNDSVMLQCFSVTPKLSDPNYNSPDLLKHTRPADQFGNYTLFN